MKPWEASRDHSDQALRMLVKAADAMIEPTREARAAALIYTAAALLNIAQSDPGEKCLGLCLEAIRALPKTP